MNVPIAGAVYELFGARIAGVPLPSAGWAVAAGLGLVYVLSVLGDELGHSPPPAPPASTSRRSTSTSPRRARGGAAAFPRGSNLLRVNVRRATAGDADVVAKLLYDFNTEYDDPTPEPPQLAERLRELFDADMIVLLAGDGPDGLALLRFRPSLWSAGLECYLAELYVVPARRGHGLGRALMEAAIETARGHGASFMDLGTSEDDVAARALYESVGFTNREGPGGPIMYVYERDL